MLRHSKNFFYISEFFAGMAVMAVELGASRLLAPYFSSSQIVWTIIIGTIMIAMALGNVYGGRTADNARNGKRSGADADGSAGESVNDRDVVDDRTVACDRLYGRMIIAALWIAAIPVIGRYLILLISGVVILAVNTGFLVTAAFLSCMIIFVFPLFLLGTVTPSLAKVTMSGMEDSGRTVGYLGAFNTIGSIIGTFLPTFVTIPSVGTAVTFYIFSGILLLIGISYFVYRKRNIKAVVCVAVFALLTVLGTGSSFAFWENDLTYEGESIYNYLQVKENDRSVILSTNVLFGVQSIRMKDDGLTGMYYDYALAAPLMTDKYRNGEHMDALVLGMGTGTFASQSRRYIDDVDFTGVEIDEKITSLAREYFELDDDIPVITYDGRAYLQADDKKYDIIMVDAYQDITIPFQMSSVEFFELVKEHLNDGGVMVVNMNMRGEKEGSINDWLQDTIASVFPVVYTADVRGSTNRELFAVKESDADLKAKLEEGVKGAKEREGYRPDEVEKLMTKVSSGLMRYEGGQRIFTDDKAPVELLGMRVIDDIISGEITYYKEIFKERGISGLLEEM